MLYRSLDLMRYCKLDNKHLVSIKVEKFLDHLLDW